MSSITNMNSIYSNRTANSDVICTTNTAFETSIKSNKKSNLMANLPYLKNSKSFNSLSHSKDATPFQKLKTIEVKAKKNNQLMREREQFYATLLEDRQEKELIEYLSATKIQAVFRGARSRPKSDYSPVKVSTPEFSLSNLNNELLAYAAKLNLKPILGLSLETKAKSSKRRLRIENAASFRIQTFFRMIVAKQRARKKMDIIRQMRKSKAANKIKRFMQQLSVLKVSKLFRGGKQKKAATVIQCCIRVFLAYNKVRFLRKERAFQSRRNDAAIKLQRSLRSISKNRSKEKPLSHPSSSSSASSSNPPLLNKSDNKEQQKQKQPQDHQGQFPRHHPHLEGNEKENNHNKEDKEEEEEEGVEVEESMSYSLEDEEYTQYEDHGEEIGQEGEGDDNNDDDYYYSRLSTSQAPTSTSASSLTSSLTSSSSSSSSLSIPTSSSSSSSSNSSRVSELTLEIHIPSHITSHIPSHISHISLNTTNKERKKIEDKQVKDDEEEKEEKEEEEEEVYSARFSPESQHPSPSLEGVFALPSHPSSLSSDDDSSSSNPSSVSSPYSTNFLSQKQQQQGGGEGRRGGGEGRRGGGGGNFVKNPTGEGWDVDGESDMERDTTTTPFSPNNGIPLSVLLSNEEKREEEFKEEKRQTLIEPPPSSSTSSTLSSSSSTTTIFVSSSTNQQSNQKLKEEEERKIDEVLPSSSNNNKVEGEEEEELLLSYEHDDDFEEEEEEEGGGGDHQIAKKSQLDSLSHSLSHSLSEAQCLSFIQEATSRVQSTLLECASDVVVQDSKPEPSLSSSAQLTPSVRSIVSSSTRKEIEDDFYVAIHSARDALQHVLRMFSELAPSNTTQSIITTNNSSDSSSSPISSSSHSLLLEIADDSSSSSSSSTKTTTTTTQSTPILLPSLTLTPTSSFIVHSLSSQTVYKALSPEKILATSTSHCSLLNGTQLALQFEQQSSLPTTSTPQSQILDSNNHHMNHKNNNKELMKFLSIFSICEYFSCSKYLQSGIQDSNLSTIQTDFLVFLTNSFEILLFLLFIDSNQDQQQKKIQIEEETILILKNTIQSLEVKEEKEEMKLNSSSIISSISTSSFYQQFIIDLSVDLPSTQVQKESQEQQQLTQEEIEYFSTCSLILVWLFYSNWERKCTNYRLFWKYFENAQLLLNSIENMSHSLSPLSPSTSLFSSFLFYFLQCFSSLSQSKLYRDLGEYGKSVQKYEESRELYMSHLNSLKNTSNENDNDHHSDALFPLLILTNWMKDQLKKHMLSLFMIHLPSHPSDISHHSSSNSTINSTVNSSSYLFSESYFDSSFSSSSLSSSSSSTSSITSLSHHLRSQLLSSSCLVNHNLISFIPFQSSSSSSSASTSSPSSTSSASPSSMIEEYFSLQDSRSLFDFIQTTHKSSSSSSSSSNSSAKCCSLLESHLLLIESKHQKNQGNLLLSSQFLNQSIELTKSLLLQPTSSSSSSSSTSNTIFGFPIHPLILPHLLELSHLTFLMGLPIRAKEICHICFDILSHFMINNNNNIKINNNSTTNSVVGSVEPLISMQKTNCYYLQALELSSLISEQLCNYSEAINTIQEELGLINQIEEQLHELSSSSSSISSSSVSSSDFKDTALGMSNHIPSILSSLLSNIIPASSSSSSLSLSSSSLFRYVVSCLRVRLGHIIMLNGDLNSGWKLILSEEHSQNLSQYTFQFDSSISSSSSCFSSQFYSYLLRVGKGLYLKGEMGEANEKYQIAYQYLLSFTQNCSQKQQNTPQYSIENSHYLLISLYFFMIENFRFSGYHKECVDLINPYLTLALQLFGENSYHVSIALLTRANLERDLNRFMEAESFYQQSLQKLIYQNIQQPVINPSTSSSSSLSTSSTTKEQQRDKGDGIFSWIFGELIECKRRNHNQLKQQQQHNNNPDNNNTNNTNNNNLDSLLNKAIDFRHIQFGPSHPFTLDSILSLALFYSDTFEQQQQQPHSLDLSFSPSDGLVDSSSTSSPIASRLTLSLALFRDRLMPIIENTLSIPSIHPRSLYIKANLAICQILINNHHNHHQNNNDGINTSKNRTSSFQSQNDDDLSINTSVSSSSISNNNTEAGGSRIRNNSTTKSTINSSNRSSSSSSSNSSLVSLTSCYHSQLTEILQIFSSYPLLPWPDSHPWVVRLGGYDKYDEELFEPEIQDPINQ